MSEQRLRQAMQLHQAGRVGEAEALYSRLLAETPRLYPALHLMGLLRFQQGRLAEALDLMNRALAVQPGAPDTLINYALALAASGRQGEALPVLRQAAAALPHSAPVRANLGGLLHSLGRHDEALRVLDEALALDGADAGALTNRGLVLQALGRLEAAAESFAAVLARAPYNVAALQGRGLALHALRRHQAALADFDRAVALAPGDPGPLVNRAAALWALGRIDAALADYDAALAAAPAHTEALASRANLLWTTRQALEPALADLKKLAALAPQDPGLAGDLLHLKLHAGEWDGFDAAKAALDQGVRAGLPMAEPFVYQGLSDSPADLLACAALQAARKFPPQPPLHGAAARATGKIRVGYVSGEFRAQATAYLAAGLYEAHDRAGFEIIGFDNSRKEVSPMRARLEAAFDGMFDITRLGDGEAAALVAAQGIDILVNLNGWFGAHRMGVFAHRPAPVQVNYLGFPGTLGAPYIDYILADAVVIPPGEERFYTETVLRLPHSYQINDDKRAVPPPPPSRCALGLPPPCHEKDGGFVFAYFSYSYKILPPMFALWLRLLRAVPGSVLWLLEPNALFGVHARAAAARGGVDPARLVMAPTLALEEHMARIGAADLGLDSVPCGGHTSASDALWAGLPLLTCRGHAFSGRVGASLLTAAGLPDLIADDLASYEARALELARNPAMLADLRHRLVAGRRTMKLFDTAATTRAIEAAYRTMLGRD